MKITTFSICISLLILLFISCKMSTEVDSGQKLSIDYSLPDWAKDATIYEVNLRQYTEEGTFKSFEEHLPRLKDMGVDILWFMPTYPISKTNGKGSLGSPYAITDYKDVNPRYGTLEDFDQMVTAIHDHDMKIILDFVPNHTGWDSEWITNHPEWYTQDSVGNIIDPIDPNTGESWGWTDVADLNYDNNEMRAAMIDAFLFWIRDHHIDGYRMDVAHNVPQDFWEVARDSIFSLDREAFMLAEAEIPEQRNSQVFHASYGWEVHHILNDIAKGNKTVRDIADWYRLDTTKYEHGFHMMFTSNHDENSWNGTVFERMGEAHKVMAIWAATFDGMPLIYSGMEEPLDRRLEFFEKDEIGFKNYSYQDFYTQLFTLKHRNEALWNGNHGGTTRIDYVDEQVMVYSRSKNDDHIKVAVNFSDTDKSADFVYDFKSAVMLSESATREDNKVNLGPWGYFVVSNK